MAMDQDTVARYGGALYQALRERTPIEPIQARSPGMTIEDAYRIASDLMDRRLADGERIVGRKIGVTSRQVQGMLDVHQPDFGTLTDAMRCQPGEVMPIGARLIQPRAEGEIAFLLSAPLKGPGVSAADVLEATEAVFPCFEIVDSRVRDWKIRIQDTVADNASSGLFVLAEQGVDPRSVDLARAWMKVYKNGTLLSEGNGETSLTGSPRLGSPQQCVAWLANTLAGFGLGLSKGDVILSGSLVPLEPVVPGDSMRLEVEGLGSVEVEYG